MLFEITVGMIQDIYAHTVLDEGPHVHVQCICYMLLHAHTYKMQL